MLERLRHKQEFASYIPHITINQGQRSEGLMYVAEMLLYVKKKKKKLKNNNKCFDWTIFKHLCTWHFCDPLRHCCLRVSVNVSCQPVFSLFSLTSSLLQIWFVILFQYVYCLQKMYKTLHLTLLNSDPCINFILNLSLTFFFFVTAKFCSWYLPFLCSFRFLWCVIIP